MKMSQRVKFIAVSTLFLAGLAACDKPGPAESAGKKLDQKVDEVNQKIDDAADKIEKKMDEQGTKAGVAIDDTEITAKAKAAIFAEPGLKTLQISVDTEKGVVTLSGSVDSKIHSEKAESLAGAVSGVSRVKNQLVVKPGK